MSRTYKLDELASAAGLSARTVRYYVQRGLLPPPVFRGRDTSYDTQHLVRLRAIAHLQGAFYPLDAIQVELERATPERLAELAAGQLVSRAPIPPLVPAVFPGTAPPAPARPRAAQWSRTELVPGLELHVAADAGAEARELADKILRLGHPPRSPRTGGSR